MIFTDSTQTIEEYDLVLWAEQWGIYGDLPQKFRLHQLIYNDNIFSRSAMKGYTMENTSLWELALKDMEVLQKEMAHKPRHSLSHYIPANQKSGWHQKEERLFSHFCHDNAADFLQALTLYYKTYGVGDLAFYPFFHWENELCPVRHPDLVEMNTLVGYEDQKRQLCENTEGFLQGVKGNHVLLYGQRGTGKSSTVKALGKLYFSQGLRIVELSRNDLKALPRLCRTLEDIGLSFIVYIDDLSFEDSETDYKSLKAVLEGSLETTGNHILLYATSNRRHLVRKTQEQRENEVNPRETEEEILSLSHRFGLAIPFFTPKQEEFLTMVETIAKERNIKTEKEELRRRAILWTRWQQGLSGRTAVQFINALEVEQQRSEQ